jgi:polyisoprenyl-teichoic acid--peptidoglycan teichoic acid transferase
LDYVRQRDFLPNTDYDRQRHQQQFIKAVFRQIVNAGMWQNPVKMVGVLNAVGRVMTIDSGGVSLDDWIFAMRNVRPSNLITIMTNGGHYNAATNAPGYVGAAQALNETSLELLRAVNDDTLDAFVAAHRDWVSNA